MSAVEEEVLRIQKKLNKMTSGDGTVGSIIIKCDLPLKRMPKYIALT